nr:hypothetical protein Iba_chr13fCG6300 [Ipomoea batatas]
MDVIFNRLWLGEGGITAIGYAVGARILWSLGCNRTRAGGAKREESSDNVLCCSVCDLQQSERRAKELHRGQRSFDVATWFAVAGEERPKTMKDFSQKPLLLSVLTNQTEKQSRPVVASASDFFPVRQRARMMVADTDDDAVVFPTDDRTHSMMIMRNTMQLNLRGRRLARTVSGLVGGVVRRGA